MFFLFHKNRAGMITGSVELHLIILFLILNLVLKKAVCKVQHVLNGSKQQSVSILIQVQLLAVVLHWQHTGQRDAQRLTQLTCLKTSECAQIKLLLLICQIFTSHHKYI